MGTSECSQLASKSSWDSQDFGDIGMVLKLAHFRKFPGHNEFRCKVEKYDELRVLRTQAKNIWATYL